LDIGASVLLVTYEDASLLKAKMMRDMTLPYPLLLDPERNAYEEWGMGRTGLFGAMLSPELNWRYLKLLLRGERFLGLAPDMFQLGGDFIVDQNGNLAFAYQMNNNGDRALVSDLVRELRKIASN
jgi:hypothetical protein